MTKRNKFYQIGFFTLAIAFIALCLFVGITAIQKQMKLNLAVKMNPSIVCEIYASMNGEEGTYNKIFSNVEGSTSIGTNWLISGNTLTYDNSSTDMGLTAHIKVTNKTTGTRIMVESGGVGKGVVETNGTTSPFAISIPAKGSVQMLFSQAFTVDVSGVDTNSATISAGQNVYTINGTYYVKSTATNAQFTLTSKEHYETPPTISSITGATYTFTNNNTITLTKINGNVSINASADPSSYTITYYLNAGDTTVHTTQSVTYGDPYSIPTEPTRADYIFLGWATSSGATSATWEAGSTSTQTCDGATAWYAVWQSNNVTITFTTSSNLQVNSINGTTITKITSLEMTKSETKNVIVTSTTAGQWSRAVTYSVTSGSADDVSLDTLTGDLTITNPSGDVTINVSVSDSNTFRPWTYGTYVNNEGSAVGDKVSYNTVHYPAFKGYKYIQFANHATQEANYYKSAAGDIGARWIIIGAGSSVSNATMLGAVQNTAVTSYAFSGIVN
ncbi:MAG: InlB B-repeat-containing protein, partial [Clostridia bacterium]|nr:InlB B-repeat-containing protein [Clostridia bacterium]